MKIDDLFKCRVTARGDEAEFFIDENTKLVTIEGKPHIQRVEYIWLTWRNIMLGPNRNETIQDPAIPFLNNFYDFISPYE